MCDRSASSQINSNMQGMVMSTVAFGIIRVECPVICNSAHKQVLVLKTVEVTHRVCLVSDASF
jgi:hypothetical protein